MNETDTAIIALMAENDKLRAQLLQAPDANLVAFFAAYELTLDNMREGLAATTGMYRGSPVHVLRGFLDGILSEYNELKAQHLGDNSKGE